MSTAAYPSAIKSFGADFVNGDSIPASCVDDLRAEVAAIEAALGIGLSNVQRTVASYILVPSVASNNLTVALKNISGSDPSPTNPVVVRIGNTLRSATAALSVTLNAGTNWFNAGSAELATKEVDYFVYLGWNATDGVTIGVARFAAAGLYSDFNVTNTNALYAGINTIAHTAAGDEYAVIGRFAAILSAGAAYQWSVPAFTLTNLISRPIYETRWLTWLPVYSASGAMTWTSVSTYKAMYQIRGDTLYFAVSASGTTGGTADKELDLTVPMDLNNNAGVAAGTVIQDGSGSYLSGILIPATPKLGFRRYDAVNFGLGTVRTANLSSFYRIF